MRTIVVLAVVVWAVIGVLAASSIKGGVESAKARQNAEIAIVLR